MKKGEDVSEEMGGDGGTVLLSVANWWR